MQLQLEYNSSYPYSFACWEVCLLKLILVRIIFVSLLIPCETLINGPVYTLSIKLDMSVQINGYVLIFINMYKNHRSFTQSCSQNA